VPAPPRRRAKLLEGGEGDAQVLAGVDPPAGTAEGLAIEQLGPGPVERPAAQAVQPQRLGEVAVGGRAGRQ